MIPSTVPGTVSARAASTRFPGPRAVILGEPPCNSTRSRPRFRSRQDYYDASVVLFHDISIVECSLGRPERNVAHRLPEIPTRGTRLQVGGARHQQVSGLG